MYTFCTIFDSRYLLRALALYQSLRRHNDSFELWVLYLDEECRRILSGLDLPGLVLLEFAALEAEDSQLLAAKSNRNAVEYYWTAKSSLLTYVFEHAPDADRVSYLDADLYFFANPDLAFQEMDGNSILISEHRFPERLRSREQFGLYNGGFISFRRDETGLACLKEWHANCIEWCYHRVEGERFGDQKYMDAWPARYPGVRALAQKGANLGPWNIGRYRIASGPDGDVRVDQDPLVFFHFHGLKFSGSVMLESGLKTYETGMLPEYKKLVFRPYMKALVEAGILVRNAGFRVPGPSLAAQFIEIKAKKLYNILGQPKFLKKAGQAPLNFLKRLLPKGA